MAGFIFGAGTPYRSYDQLVRARKAADGLAQVAAQGPGANSLPEGIASLGAGILAALMGNRADKMERAGKAEYNSRFSNITKSLLGGPKGGGLAAGPQPAKTVASALTQQPRIEPASFNMGTKPSSKTTGKTDWLRYSNQNAIRNDPLHPNLVNALDGVARDLGVTVEVFSGGQEAKGPNRTGSTRHDHGNAADVFLYKDGRRLNWQNPADRPIFEEVVRRGKSAGLTGFGAGDGYMQAGSMHIGFGSPGVWGAGGKGANAPQWLRAAYEGGPSSAPAPMAAPTAMASAMPSPMPAPTVMASALPGPMPTPGPQMAAGGPQVIPASAPPPMAQPAPMASASPMTAYQRMGMRQLGNEVGLPTQQRAAREAAIMGRPMGGGMPSPGFAPSMAPAPMGGPAPSPAPAQGGFFTSMLPAGTPPEQAATIAQAEQGLDAMPIEQIAEMANSPFAEDWQEDVMKQYLEYRMKQVFADPRDNEMKRIQLELERRKLAPEPKARPATTDEKRRLNLPENAPVYIKPDGTPELIDTSKLGGQADPTTNMRELSQINQERAAKGQPPLTLEEYLASKRGNGITVGPDGTVQIGGPPGKLTEQQSKDVGFYNRAYQVAPLLDGVDKDLVDGVSENVRGVPVFGNYLQTDEYRKARQLGDEFLLALLRKDTGAAVTDGEMALYGGTYLPRAGDDAETIRQKRASRARAIEGIRMGLGPAQILFNEREEQKKNGPQVSGGAPQYTPEQIAAAKSRWGVQTDAEAIQKLQQNKAEPTLDDLLKKHGG